MIRIEKNKDEFELEIHRVGKLIGYIRWNPEREPRIILTQGSESYLTLDEISAILFEYRKCRKLPLFV